MNAILDYYGREGSPSVANRFFEAFLNTVARAAANPSGFHVIAARYRRANIPGFPYHFLYRSTVKGIRILVLRHDRRHPDYGLRRG
ncbi:type II toxin-antitoxin system RelE/ParE family toxin [Luteolibacter pohnpeiensis]|uniref:Type II toxin-antitoxin system RelE/ParE family toxin n=2 Tax=Luteolibacter pohnpeiensis TaxID=454153 RepID=A0A934S8Y3_9BACT|nr:type II toxin-antitoxin system RelE/ParE family toxin [Luteolibacter pohnpeiensis]